MIRFQNFSRGRMKSIKLDRFFHYSSPSCIVQNCISSDKNYFKIWFHYPSNCKNFLGGSAPEPTGDILTSAFPHFQCQMFAGFDCTLSEWIKISMRKMSFLVDFKKWRDVISIEIMISLQPEIWDIACFINDFEKWLVFHGTWIAFRHFLRWKWYTCANSLDVKGGRLHLSKKFFGISMAALKHFQIHIMYTGCLQIATFMPKFRTDIVFLILALWGRALYSAMQIWTYNIKEISDFFPFQMIRGFFVKWSIESVLKAFLMR